MATDPLPRRHQPLLTGRPAIPGLAARARSVPHRHALYEAAVQCVDFDLDMASRLFRRKRGRGLKQLKEDFCGTAWLSCRWAKRNRDHRAWGVDLDSATLVWGRQHRLAHIGDAAGRVDLTCADVRSVRTPRVDAVMALNFSYFVFKQRSQLLGYFRAVRESLHPDGMFFLDLFGGTESMTETVERTRIPASRQIDGTRVPAFTFVWEQAAFNPADHHILCHIHFELPRGVRVRKAFTYDWRLWTIPELRELLDEAGFASSDVYVEGWDDDREEADSVFRRRKRFENQECWLAYMVAWA